MVLVGFPWTSKIVTFLLLTPTFSPSFENYPEPPIAVITATNLWSNLTQQLPSLVGDDLGEECYKWQCGALAMDGVVYGIPSCSSRVLTIADLIKGLSATLQTNMKLYPNEFVIFLHDDLLLTTVSTLRGLEIS